MKHKELEPVTGCMIIEASERWKRDPADPKIKTLVDAVVGAYIIDTLEPSAPGGDR